MTDDQLSPKDLDQITERGLTSHAVMAQRAVIRTGLPPARLARPCTLGDGIRRIDGEDAVRLADLCRQAANAGRIMSFVPASGAASRMFKDLHTARHYFQNDLPFPCDGQPPSADPDLRPFCRFAENLHRFAFFPLLVEKMEASGLDLDRLVEKRNFGIILDYLLTDKGLGYAHLPKGLIAFHRYPDHCRTAMEEHLVEAAAISKDSQGQCRLHFTLSPEHEQQVLAHLAQVLGRYEAEGTRFTVDFSHQLPATDTIALDSNGHLLRDAQGRLVFRPGGHGALLENLNRLDADILLIKNIDNVIPDRLKPESHRIRSLLVGLLVALQTEAFRLVKALAAEPCDPAMIAAAENFAIRHLEMDIPESVRSTGDEKRRQWLMEKLDRPMRVCGMVRNVGAPGGGPFWTINTAGELSRQIVESAHVDMESGQQKAIWQSATHFNPVLLACAMRNHAGQPYDLMRFVDPQTAFIVRKSIHGQAIMGLEHPGLWNGAMAHWNTIFVEVPIALFNPVKSVLALLEAAHQPQETNI